MDPAPLDCEGEVLTTRPYVLLTIIYILGPIKMDNIDLDWEESDYQSFQPPPKKNLIKFSRKKVLCNIVVHINNNKIIK